MPTNSIKHRMLKEAKRIANKEYRTITKEIQLKNDGDTIRTVISPEIQREWNIDEILDNHPDYDEDIFRGMIRTFQKKDNSDERSD
jgi:hypothetical protein